MAKRLSIVSTRFTGTGQTIFYTYIYVNGNCNVNYDIKHGVIVIISHTPVSVSHKKHILTIYVVVLGPY